MRTSQMLRLMLMAGSVTLASGCATVVTRLGRSPPYDHFYVATKLDVGLYREVGRGNDVFRGGPASFLLWAPWITIDLPISLVSDTVLLPYDGVRYARLDSPGRASVATFTVRNLHGNWVLLDRNPVPIAIVDAPTVGSMNPLIALLAKDISGSVEAGFTLLVSAAPLAGNYHRLTKGRICVTSVWYYSDELKQEIRLSREILRQYRREPESIYLGIEKAVPNDVPEDTARKFADPQH